MKLTPVGKKVIQFLVTLGVVGGGYFGYQYASNNGLLDSLAPTERQAEDIPKGTFAKADSDQDAPVTEKVTESRPIKISVNTWGGFAGGQYFNGSFDANEESRYWKDYKLKVQFVLMDDFNTSREAFKSGDIDLLWATVDSFPIEVNGLKAHEPQILFQTDWSRGGDAIVVRHGINSVADLKGKKIALASGTPSNTFLLWMLDAADMKYTDVEIVEAATALDAAQYFKAGQVDAAVVWSPDDEDCVQSVTGAKVLKSTKDASKIIADVLYVRKDFLEKNRAQLKDLIEGWMIGAAELNSSPEARKKAVKILAKGLKQPEDFIAKAIDNVRLTTYGDNVNFFNLKGNYKGVKGEDLYNTMAKAFANIRLAPSSIPAWRTVSDGSLIADLEDRLAGKPGQEAEDAPKFAPATEKQKEAQAISTKRVTINFPTGVSELDENAKYIIQIQFGDLAKAFANARIRIEGNTDSTGSADVNKALSYKRAQSVAGFLAKEYNFDADRFVVVGNGPQKPVASNDTDEGRSKNRRTDFEILGD